MYFLEIPAMVLIFNNQLISSNQTISFFKNSLNYQFVCSSIDSNPDVNLSLYDTNSLISLATNANSVIQKICNATTNLCRNILQVNFKFNDNSLDNLTSLTCAANSSNSDISLYTYITRKVSVLLPGRKN